MNRVIVIGGGFAGLAAAEKLRSLGRQAEVVLIDRKRTFDFLPMLPDVIGERANPDHLANPLDKLSASLGARFVCDAVTAIDLDNRTVRTEGGAFEYDYAVVASGSQTDFHGQDKIEKEACALDAVEDARRILALLKENAHDAFVVAGGGYTGVETATNLAVYLSRHQLRKRVVVCEYSGRILSVLPEKFHRYATANLERLGIETRLKTTVSDVADGAVTLSSGETISRALLIWAAGVQTPEFVRRISVPQNRQGRLEIDGFLRIGERCFVAGDAAQFVRDGKPLRMSVQFALTQGWCAGANIVRAVRGRPLRPFSPADPGYIIPMANNRSCGLILGVSVTGFAPTLLHYLMCIFRSRGLARRLRMLWQLRRIL